MAIAQCLVLFALVIGAAAHGGTFHEWPGTPTGSNYIRTKIASCNSWVPAQGSVKYSLVDAAANATGTPEVKGDVTVWNYLYRNCSLTNDTLPSAGVEFNATLLRNGKPAGNITLDGVAMTGSCASGGGAPYYFDPTADPVNASENLLWFHDFTLPSNGSMRGNGANDGLVLTSGPNAVRSVMLLNTETQEALACCDLTLAGPANTDWAATLQGKGKYCEPEDDHSTHGAAVAKSVNATADDHAGHDHDDHAGHDHDDHAGHDHDDHAGHDHSMEANGTTAAAARSTSSAAAVGASAALMLAVAVVAMLGL